jgi:hypothetical protein
LAIIGIGSVLTWISHKRPVFRTIEKIDQVIKSFHDFMKRGFAAPNKKEIHILSSYKIASRSYTTPARNALARLPRELLASGLAGKAGNYDAQKN